MRSLPSPGSRADARHPTSPRRRGEVKTRFRALGLLQIQLLVITKNAVLVERDTPVAGEIGLDVGPRGDAVVQIDQAGNFALEWFHALWKCVTQSFDDLEQRQVSVSEPAAGQIRAAVVFQQLFEIA